MFQGYNVTTWQVLMLCCAHRKCGHSLLEKTRTSQETHLSLSQIPAPQKLRDKRYVKPPSSPAICWVATDDGYSGSLTA